MRPPDTVRGVAGVGTRGVRQQGQVDNLYMDVVMHLKQK